MMSVWMVPGETTTGATGTYLIDFPEYTDTEDTAGTIYGCFYRAYDGHGYAGGAQSWLTLGELTATDRYSSACGSSPSGLLRTTFTYDQYGNPLTTDDPDANANIAGHTGCTVCSTKYTTC